MPRSKRSNVSATLDFFKSGEPGEVKVVFELAQGIMRERFTPAKVAVARKKATPTPKAKAAAAASTSSPEEALS